MFAKSECFYGDTKYAENKLKECSTYGQPGVTPWVYLLKAKEELDEGRLLAPH